VAGALEMFAADPPLIIYKQLAGASEAFAVDPVSVDYERSIGLLAFSGDS
jgi:hypothetical protein